MEGIQRESRAKVLDKLYIVMPVYNEAGNLRQTVRDWYEVTQVGEDSRLLLIDDGSKDGSYDLLLALQKEYPRLEVLTKANSGHGPTVRLAYKEALERGADYVFQTDSDGQTLPSEFYTLWEERTKYQVQIGSRLGRQDGLGRKLVSRVLRMVLHLYFRVKTVDPNTPFRLFDRASLALFLPLLPEDFALTNALTSVYTSYSQLRSRYVPITFRPRQAGTNSINYRRIVRIALENMKKFPALNQRMRQDLAIQQKTRLDQR